MICFHLLSLFGLTKNGHFKMKVQYSSQFQWLHWEWLKSNFQRSTRSSFSRTLKIRLDFFGLEASSKKLSTEREEKRGASSSYSEYFYAGIVMVEYKEICGTAAAVAAQFAKL